MNIHSKLFRRADIKNNVYRKIAAEMQMDDEAVKKKIRNLRTAYTAERKKLSVATKSGMGADEIPETNLFYYSEMEFLDPCIVYRRGTNNFDVSIYSSKNRKYLAFKMFFSINIVFTLKWTLNLFLNPVLGNNNIHGKDY